MTKTEKQGLVGVCLILVLLGLAAIITAMDAKAGTTIYYETGATLVVPDNWTVDVYPKNFNSRPFDMKTNPAGKAPGWLGWPLYSYLCPAVDFSPINPLCEMPYFQAAPVYDFYDYNKDGIVDWGSQAGCSYDPLVPESKRKFTCSK